MPGWLVRAITSKMTSFPAVVAGLLISTVNSNVAWPISIIAETCILNWKIRVTALASKVPHLTTCMADWIIGAMASMVSRLLAVPTHSI